jgi:chorismate-pyruvate lyase
LQLAFAGLTAVLLAAGCASPELPAFERTLAAQDSATAALGEWCAARHLADPARISASPVRDADAAPPGDLRALLGADGPVGYRHVRLACGGVVLSEAHNWYLPSRLTPAMNATLAASDTPFGKVVAPLHFTREPLDSRRGRGPDCPVGTVLECYTSANLRHR